MEVCSWCFGKHSSDSCPLVKRREYYSSGALRLVEFHDARAGARPDLPERVTTEEMKAFKGSGT